MRWWLNTDHKAFSVDNAAVRGMDFSSLDPSIWMVQWIEGKGEIERQTPEGDNENGLREPFFDIVPYAPFFQEFMEKVPNLTLPQAKKIQIDLIVEVYNAKVQAPFHYPVAAGDYWWDASSSSSNTNASIQSVITTLNTLIGKVNALAGEINSIVVTQTNANIATKVNVDITTLNQMVGHINTSIVNQGNNYISDINTYTIGVITGSLVPWIDNTIVDTLNARLQRGAFTVPLGDAGSYSFDAATPGLAGNIAHINFGWPLSGYRFAALTSSFAGVSGIAGVNWTNMATMGAPPGGQYVPIGATDPVSLTAAEIAGIENGIALRANDLDIIKNKKIAEVKDLTTVQEVIDYDVTTGWEDARY